MTVEFIGVIRHRVRSEIFPLDRSIVPDRGYLRDFAQAHERGGFDRVDKRSWTCVAALTGARDNTMGLVGALEQVADALLDHCRLAVSTLLIRVFDPLKDEIAYGARLIRLARALIAAQEAQSAPRERRA